MNLIDLNIIKCVAAGNFVKSNGYTVAALFYYF